MIPGLWLMTRWSLFAPVIVRELLGPLAALMRSNELVRGHFEVVFLTAAFAVVLEEAVADAGTLAGLALTGSESWGEWIGGSIATVLILPVVSFATALTYGHLQRSEGNACTYARAAQQIPYSPQFAEESFSESRTRRAAKVSNPIA